jgi:arylsulfatase A
MSLRRLPMLMLPGLLSVSPPVQAQERPNIVLIFADDLGYGDIGCYGAKDIKTPNLDRLVREGIRFTDFYAAQPVCTASRVGLLTGCYPNRLGMHGALGPKAQIDIHLDETLLPELLRQQGYATGIIGKWHLGNHPDFLPTKHGFDTYFGLPYSNDMWPHHPESPRNYPPLPLYENDRIVDEDVSPEDQSHLTEQYGQRAVRFIEANREKPFFLYFAHTFPHFPLYAGANFRGKSKHGLYGDVIEEMDAAVGDILTTLKKHKLEKKTIVIFTSDNGPWRRYGNHAGSPGPLREGKGTVFEGGVRVPFIARWPGHIPARRVLRTPAMNIDLLPTLARQAGAGLPARAIDGKDIMPLLAGQRGAKSPHDAYLFYYNQNELQALRSGQWKLILPHTMTQSVEGKPVGKDGTPGEAFRQTITSPELYNLSADVGEKQNVAAKQPKVMERLLALVAKARQTLGDSLTKQAGSETRAPGRVTMK